MTRITNAAYIGVISLGITLAGCASGTEVADPSTTNPSTTVSRDSDPDTTTLHQYIVDNKIAEVRFRRGDPDTPKIEFPFPPGWSWAGDRTPDWAYGAIVYDTPRDPQNPPYMVAITSRLTGDVDTAKILKYAPAQLNTLSDFTPLYPPRRDSISGFEATDYAGTYDRNGQLRVVGQLTIVVPGENALFVLQLNADAPQADKQPVVDAAKFIAEHTKIGAPS